MVDPAENWLKSFNPEQMSFFCRFFFKLFSVCCFHTIRAIFVFLCFLFCNNSNLLFAQSAKSTLTDIDGNVYKTIRIGEQWWMKENLKVTRFSNGDTLKTIKPDTLDLSEMKEPKFQFSYKSDAKLASTYGLLYTWYAVTDKRNICPKGWHVPSDEEWCMLENAVEPGCDSACSIWEHRGRNQGGNMKEIGNLHWIDNVGATDQSGFTVLPAGIRYFNGYFHQIGHYAYFWTTDEKDKEKGLSRRFYHDKTDISRSGYYKGCAVSIRCVKDE